ncbi:MAG: type 1 glutamine amidotransferase [Campylobacterales bacterium]|nr:type 1 glutamine amidotransferase [Campylobacterales bacterium]
MIISIWQHVDFEGPSAIEEWAKERGHTLEIVRADYDEPFIARDALVVLGGSMSVYDSLPFLSSEKTALKSYINRGGKVFGICLGSQLIADVLGAKVYPSGTREAGWRKVNFAKHAMTEALGDEATVFHWHGDTFDLPPGAELLASNDAFKNQMFCAKGCKVVATQFHFESTAESVEDLLYADGEYLNSDSPFVQNADEIRAGGKHTARANELLFRLLDKWISL